MGLRSSRVAPERARLAPVEDRDRWDEKRGRHLAGPSIWTLQPPPAAAFAIWGRASTATSASAWP